MATKIKSMRDRYASQRIEYPWENWADGDCWLLEHGTDFSCNVVAFRQAVYRHARRSFNRVRTVVVDENFIQVKFYGGKR